MCNKFPLQDDKLGPFQFLQNKRLQSLSFLLIVSLYIYLQPIFFPRPRYFLFCKDNMLWLSGHLLGPTVLANNLRPKLISSFGPLTAHLDNWRNRIYNVSLSSKVFTAVAVALMVENGYLKYSDKIVDLWPEFGQGGKADITVELSRRLGVPLAVHVLIA